MAIYYQEDQKIFHLLTKHSAYRMQLKEDGYLAHVYWGKRTHFKENSQEILHRDRGFSPNPTFGKRAFSLDTLPQEYPQYGNGDFRSCAYQIEDENGCRMSDLRYMRHEIYQGRKPLHQLPHVYEDKKGEVETLEIIMYDTVLQLEVVLQYHVFEEKDIFTRSTQFINKGTNSISLLRALSMNVDLRRDDLEVVSLYGSHNNERNYERRKLSHDRTVIESTRGASSPHHAPFVALAQEHANEHHGEIYALHFVYSGNFQINIEQDVLHTTRVNMGLHPFDFTWLLTAGDSFQTPEVILAYSDQGMNGISKILHRVYRDNVCRGTLKHKPRPILINNWEATYFDFNEKSLLALAKKAASCGIELFVLDDGWFKNRNSDTTSLGDWICDEKKIPHGLGALAKEINDMGLLFGIWVEPEMVSVDSDLYRSHPKYCIQAPSRNHTFGRDQLVLDMSREDVRNYVFDALCKVFDSANIAYVKWDMNRHICDWYSEALPVNQQKELAHRYILGLYDLMERLVSRYPNILFESCSSGGGRFDPGMLYYMPQTWTSDNTDAICRSHIQYTTSFMYPLITMGSHVSASPNEQVGRMTPLATRGNVAMFGNLGYELDLLKLSSSEIEDIKKQVEEYKEIRNCIQFGNLYRISNPFEKEYMAMNVVSEDGKEALLLYVKMLSKPNAAYDIVRWIGLEEDAVYEDVHTKKQYYGDQLMYAGSSIAYVPLDFYSKIIHLRKVERS
ncbi:alpha-galactosidase [Amedibacillus sp. YH-ame10]